MSRFDRIVKELDELRREFYRLQESRAEFRANLQLFRKLRDEALQSRYLHQELREAYSSAKQQSNPSRPNQV